MNKQSSSFGRELLVFAIAVCVSAAVLPGLIYIFGGRLFGAYGTAGGIGNIYQAVFADLAGLKVAAWIIVFAPALCLSLLRWIFRLTQTGTTTRSTARTLRKEPTINS